MVKFFPGEKLAQLQASRAYELVLRRVGGDALDAHDSHKKIGDGEEAEPDTGGLDAIRFGLNVGEASAGKQSFHGVMQVVARQRFADLQRGRGQQRGRFLGSDSGQLDLIDRQTKIGGDRSKLRRRLLRLLPGGLRPNRPTGCGDQRQQHDKACEEMARDVLSWQSFSSRPMLIEPIRSSEPRARRIPHLSGSMNKSSAHVAHWEEV